MSTQPNQPNPNVWTPMKTPPDVLFQHPDVFFENTDERTVFVNGCKTCKELKKDCRCAVPVITTTTLFNGQGLHIKLSELVMRSLNGSAAGTIEAPPPPTVGSPAQTAVTFFESIALPLVGRGWKVVPLYPKLKKVHTVLVPEPLTMASGEPAQIHEWGKSEPNANVGVYAEQVPGGMLFLDKDGAVNLAGKYEQETGKTFPKTLYVRSSVIDDGKGGVNEKGHWYFLQSSKTLTADNISEDATGGLFGLRLRNEYVCSIGSIHSKTGKPYEICDDRPVIPIPDDVFEWLQKQIIEKPKTREAIKKRGKLTKGTRYPSLISQAGKLWEQGHSREMVITASIDWARENFDVPEGAFDEDLVRAEVTRIVDTYKQGDPASKIVLIDGKMPGSHSVGTVPVSQPVAPEIDQTSLTPRPVFPLWAISETTLYEHFVRPVVESSSKNPEFLWLPSVQIMMNYLSGRVRIENQSLNWNLFLGLVSDPGKYFKSSSCKLAQQYFELMGLAQTYTSLTRNAEGKVIIMQAGSSEGFGLAMHKIVANHAIMFNDELGKLVAKAGIENSAMPNDILSWYERDYFGNTTSNQKIKFSFPADTYTFGMCWCTTTRGFGRHWPKLAGIVSGMEDRMFFCVGAEKPRPLVPLAGIPSLQDGALKTRRAIDLAVAKGVYHYEDIEEARQMMARWTDPRSQGIVEKLAAYFCIDLQRDFIDAECIERAGALCDFRNATLAHLAPIEADNQIGRVQQEMTRELRRNGGKMTYREFFQNLQGSRLGMPLWRQCYKTMVEEHLLVEFSELGKRGQKRHMVGLPKIEDDD